MDSVCSTLQSRRQENINERVVLIYDQAERPGMGGSVPAVLLYNDIIMFVSTLCRTVVSGSMMSQKLVCYWCNKLCVFVCVPV